MIIFMGVAGAGKSSQGRLLADAEGLPWLSTGEFLRMLIAGDKRKDMLAGKLLPDQEIIGLVRRIFSVINTDKEFVIDGFPRTVAQADWLLNQAKHGQLNITAVVHIEASKAAVTRRLLARGRLDDTKEAIKARFEEYEQFVVPILEHFKQSGVKVVDVDGEQPVDKVQAEISRALAFNKEA